MHLHSTVTFFLQKPSEPLTVDVPSGPGLWRWFLSIMCCESAGGSSKSQSKLIHQFLFSLMYPAYVYWEDSHMPHFRVLLVWLTSEGAFFSVRPASPSIEWQREQCNNQQQNYHLRLVPIRGDLLPSPAPHSWSWYRGLHRVFLCLLFPLQRDGGPWWED